MVPEKRQRPLSLMHVCQECALFSVRRQKPTNNNENLQQTLIVAPPFCSTDSELSPSPFSSPASSADSSPETSSGLPSPKPAHIRHRSNSECIATSPVKSILKRRPMFRSLSVCEEDNYEILKYYGNSLEDVSESSTQFEEDVLGNSLNSFKKKSVSFNERVEQNFFRPNSSILGQRKKNQRKNKHRKRRESTDSVVSSENEDENHKNHATTNSNRKQNDDSSAQTLPNVPSETTIEQSISSSSSSAAIEEKAIPPPDKTSVVHVVEQEAKTTKKGGKETKNSKKKSKDRKQPVVNALFSDDRYKGFVIGVQRRASSDSALSLSTDDDDENNNNNGFIKTTCGESRLSLKDSGIDDEMEELCAQMTAAVVSA